MPWRATANTTALALAPTARRRPISRVRRVTANASVA